MDDPPGSRLFVVCGKNAEEETLLEAFRAFGHVQNIKVLREKGVAYIKFDKASSAAAAIEMLHEVVLNDGKGPKVKVMLAESPNQRRSTAAWPPSRPESPPGQHSDPDNVPPRSRLFLVVPKNADAGALEDAMNQYSNLTYCKTDLISSKGIVFCKFSKASSALYAMEHINESAMLAGYKVKCLLAEPKGKRSRSGLDSTLTGLDLSPMVRADLAGAITSSLDGLAAGYSDLSLAGAGLGAGMGFISQPDYNMRNALGALLGLQGGATGNVMGTPQALMAQLQNPLMTVPGPAQQPSLLNTPYADMGQHAAFGANPSYAALAGLTMPYNQGILGSGPDLALGKGTPGPLDASNKARLFVVVHKSVTAENLARLFASYPGMEYCDLKRDKSTGESKGYAFVSYTTYESAKLAIDQLNGMRFPPHSTHWIKVMFALPPTQPGGKGGAGGMVPMVPETHSPPNTHLPEMNSHTSSLTSPLQATQLLGSVTRGSFTASLSSPHATPPALAIPHNPQMPFSTLGFRQPSLPGAMPGSLSLSGALSNIDTAAFASSLFGPAANSVQSTPQRGFDTDMLRSPSGPCAGELTRERLAMSMSLSEGNGMLKGVLEGRSYSYTPGYNMGTDFGMVAPGTPVRVPQPVETSHGLVHHSSMSQADAQELLHIKASLGAMSSYNAAGPESGSFESTNGPSSLTYEPLFGSPISKVAASLHSPAPVMTGANGVHSDLAQAASLSTSAPSLCLSQARGAISGAAVGLADTQSGALLSPAALSGVVPASDDSAVVYTVLTRPLPQYALEHVFKQVGDVETVTLYGPDQRYGRIRFSSSAAVQAALAQLNGAEVLGEILHVSKVDPLEGLASGEEGLGPTVNTPPGTVRPAPLALGREQ